MMLKIEGIEHAHPTMIMVSSKIIRIEFLPSSMDCSFPGSWVYDVKTGAWVERLNEQKPEGDPPDPA